MPMTPLAFIDQYLARYQSHNPALWNYEDGCVLTGCRQLYQATGEEKYLRFVLDYLDARVAADGTIPTFDTGNYNIDAINCGKALFLAWDATGEEKYRKALDFHAGRLAGHPRCVCGSFWHKEIYPWQVWLDGLYMAQPFAMEYETRFGGRAGYGDILRQFRNARTYLYDPAKGLSYHGWDERRQQPWSNPGTGCSPNFWSRAMGWYLMALIDAVEACDRHLRGLSGPVRSIPGGRARHPALSGRGHGDDLPGNRPPRRAGQLPGGQRLGHAGLRHPQGRAAQGTPGGQVPAPWPAAL